MRNSAIAWAIAAGLAALLLLPSVPALGHIQPSVNENNRYLKLGLLGDRIRMVYTVYLGERPGALARRALDRNRDRLIDDQEANRYGKEMGDQIRGGLTLEVDGAPYPLTWNQISVGMGTPTVAAGAFSVDLVVWICLAEPARRRQHTFVLHDAFRLPQAGESEIYVEESPGVTVTRSTLGSDAKQSQLKFAWRGDTGFLRDLGLYLSFSVGSEVAIAADATCGQAAPAAAPTPAHRGWAIVVLFGLLAIVGLVLLLRRS